MYPATNKKALAEALGISRSLLYYQHKQPTKDWELKCQIEDVLRIHPSYGHKRLALHLGINKKRVLRVMKLFGIQPYRRRGRKWRQSETPSATAPANALLLTFPEAPHQIWVSDFTYLRFKGRWVYVATLMDLFTRQIVGISVLTNHSTQLIINALVAALGKHPPPQILHSDQGSEYTSKDYAAFTEQLGITLSMSAKGCPWENGYQESFYSQFKLDLGDPNRFASLGELVYRVYQTIYTYNHARIHSALRMPPATFASQYALLQAVSN